MLHFWKMNGAGNDFVVLDNRDLGIDLSKEAIARLCHRQFGIGADGLLAAEPAEGEADFRMRYYNADGGEAEMCGNGARCFARFVNTLAAGGALKATSFETMAGVIRARFSGNGDVCVNLSDPCDISFDEMIDIDGDSLDVHVLNTGVPHAVIVVDDLTTVDLPAMGAALRHHDRFAPAGTNVNFVEFLGPAQISVRTYERGVENETLACGTGMVASAIAATHLTGDDPPVTVRVHSGDELEVNFAQPDEDTYRKVTLTGPAEFVFEGEIDLETL